MCTALLTRAATTVSQVIALPLAGGKENLEKQVKKETLETADGEAKTERKEKENTNKTSIFCAFSPFFL